MDKKCKTHIDTHAVKSHFITSIKSLYSVLFEVPLAAKKNVVFLAMFHKVV